MKSVQWHPRSTLYWLEPQNCLTWHRTLTIPRDEVQVPVLLECGDELKDKTSSVENMNNAQWYVFNERREFNRSSSLYWGCTGVQQVVSDLTSNGKTNVVIRRQIKAHEEDWQKPFDQIRVGLHAFWCQYKSDVCDENLWRLEKRLFCHPEWVKSLAYHLIIQTGDLLLMFTVLYQYINRQFLLFCRLRKRINRNSECAFNEALQWRQITAFIWQPRDMQVWNHSHTSSHHCSLMVVLG